MSFHVFFDFSSGLEKSLFVPKGTLDEIMRRVAHIENVFGFKVEKYKDNPPHWCSTKPNKKVTDEVYCDEAERHNEWVRSLYGLLSEWSEHPVKDGEELTPEAATKFWHGLRILDVPVSCWTDDYYKARMNALYEAMRGRECEGMEFDAKALNIKQAAAVIRLFDQYLDPGDIRLEVPKGHDSLYSSDDYAWCDKCGAIHWDDFDSETRNCRKRGGCVLKKEYGRSDEE